MTQNAFDSRRWVLPVASTIPLLAIAFAFSLGPSPRKQLQVIYQAEQVDSAKLSAVVAANEPVIEALAEDVQRPDSPHREAIIRFLGEKGYKPASPMLRRLVTTPTERAPIRTAALEALKVLDPRGLKDLAQSLREEGGALGKAARQLLAELSSGRS